MIIYLLRHAIAAPAGLAAGAPDSERLLTPAGKRRMRRIAAGMKRLGLRFDVLLTSPYLRAAQTAEIVAQTFKAREKLKTCALLVADGAPRALVKHLRKSHRAAGSVLLVGHEPFLSMLASLLLTGRSSLHLTLKKGGLCALNVERFRAGPCACLEWLLAPRHLVRLGKA